MNRVNDRKEFFRVPLKEICAVVNAKGLDVKFTMLAEAKEFRQSRENPQLAQALQDAAPQPTLS